MAFSVETYTGEQALEDAIQGAVTTLSSEQALEDYLEAANPALIHSVITKGAFFTVIEDPQIVNVSLVIVAKGGFFSVILETV